MPDPTQLLQEIRTERCDFCHAPGQGLTVYPCADFTVYYSELVGSPQRTVIVRIGVQPRAGELLLKTFDSQGGWAACPVCAGLIDRDQWVMLQRRQIEALVPPDLAGGDRTAQITVLNALVLAFRERRIP